MCALLKPIHRRFLPHSMTVFNKLGKGEEYLVVVISHVNFADSNSFNFQVTGTSTADAFRVVVDCKNSDSGGRMFVPVLEWAALSETEQKDGTRFTLHRDMYLFRGEHPSFKDGELVQGIDLTAKKLAALGLRLLTTNLFDMAGLEVPHHIQLAG